MQRSIVTQDLNKIKHPSVDIVKYETCATCQQKNSVVVGARQSFQFFR